MCFNQRSRRFVKVGLPTIGPHTIYSSWPPMHLTLSCPSILSNSCYMWPISCVIMVTPSNEWGERIAIYKWIGWVWGADHTNQFRHHPSAYLVVTMWKVVGQHLFLNIIPNNLMPWTGEKALCDRGMRL